MSLDDESVWERLAAMRVAVMQAEFQLEQLQAATQDCESEMAAARNKVEATAALERWKTLSARWAEFGKQLQVLRRMRDAILPKDE